MLNRISQWPPGTQPPSSLPSWNLAFSTAGINSISPTQMWILWCYNSTNVSSKNVFSVEQLDRNMHVQKKQKRGTVGGMYYYYKMDGTQHINIGFLNIQRKAKRKEKKVNVLAVIAPFLTRHCILSNQSCFSKRVPFRSGFWWVNTHSVFTGLGDLLPPPRRLKLGSHQWFSKLKKCYWDYKEVWSWSSSIASCL